jgi:hypothetical protein
MTLGKKAEAKMDGPVTEGKGHALAARENSFHGVVTRWSRFGHAMVTENVARAGETIAPRV